MKPIALIIGVSCALASPALARQSTGAPVLANPHAAPPATHSDHAADRMFDPTEMTKARTQLRLEHGGMVYSQVMANLAEYQAGPGENGYRWSGEAWYGGDINRVVLKTEGEGAGGNVEAAEVQALASRAISPMFNLRAGVRQDLGAGSDRTYATLALEGVAPYWSELEGAIFLSTRGEVLARVESSYDLRITQRLILQPRAEINLAGQTSWDTQAGSGLSNAELGLRLRYELRRELAPYVGISYERRYGKTADFARVAGADVAGTRLVIGVRGWF
jgi:copper resistance protein B